MEKIPFTVKYRKVQKQDWTKDSENASEVSTEKPSPKKRFSKRFVITEKTALEVALQMASEALGTDVSDVRYKDVTCRDWTPGGVELKAWSEESLSGENPYFVYIAVS